MELLRQLRRMLRGRLATREEAMSEVLKNVRFAAKGKGFSDGSVNPRGERFKLYVWEVAGCGLMLDQDFSKPGYVKAKSNLSI